MTPTEATELGKRIINAWHGAAPLAQWIEELIELDAGRAGTAFVRCRRELEHAPSIARFMAEYKSLDTTDGSSRPECGWCWRTGWIEAGRYEYKGDVQTGVQPCPHCDTGRDMARSKLWQGAPYRQFITDAEADRLMVAIRTLPKEQT